MHIDPKATVAGYPVLLVRQALRKLREIDTWDSGMLEVAAGLPAGAGLQLARALAAEGLIRRLQKDVWTMCQAGMTFTVATAAKRLTRATAERALTEFMDRVDRVNTDPYFLGKVTRVALFGSMLNTDTDRPSDIDVAVEIAPKITEWASHIEKNNERVQELMTRGHHFRHTIEYAACWQLEVFRFLKGRSRAISLAYYSIEKRLVLAVAHRMLLGDDEPAPVPWVPSDDAPVSRRRRRSRDCPF
jgi:predicted nucleotidyltransferase